MDQALQFWNLTISVLRWTLPIALLVLAIVQIIYLMWLNANVDRARRRERVRTAPQSPIMPTNPEENLLYPTGGPAGNAAGGGAADLTVESNKVTSKMVVLSGLPNVSELKLPSNDFAIGRFYNPDHNVLIALDERSVSRRHATFHGDDAKMEYYLMDTSSSYGTSLRRGEQFEPLTPGKEVRIYNGDVVQFGSAVSVRFVLPGDTRAFATQV